MALDLLEAAGRQIGVAFPFRDHRAGEPAIAEQRQDHVIGNGFFDQILAHAIELAVDVDGAINQLRPGLGIVVRQDEEGERKGLDMQRLMALLERGLAKLAGLFVAHAWFRPDFLDEINKAFRRADGAGGVEH